MLTGTGVDPLRMTDRQLLGLGAYGCGVRFPPLLPISPVPSAWFKHAYINNIASYRNGVGYGSYQKIDGFSESLIDYIHVFESMEDK